MKTLALALVLAGSFYLVRHMPEYITRGEQGPFETRAACEAELTAHANQIGLECVPALW